mgnify:CR=1 FL=1|tara:strand:- start:451 stop:1527 length:1077 start_codon:yes stop_codon:yes gene_type:complete
MASQVSKLSILLAILTVQSTGFAQNSINEQARKIYAAAGMSGLRKSIAFDAPIGDLLSRTGTHRAAALSNSSQQDLQNYSSSTVLGQFNSIFNIANQGDTSYFFKTTARHVDFEEADLLQASSKRLDVGVIGMQLSKSNLLRYLGVSYISEENIGRPQFIDAYRIGNGSGFRLEGGAQFTNNWAFSFRSDYLDWGGNNVANIPALPVPISNSVDQVRKYHNVDLIRVMPSLGGVGQWRSGVHFLDSSYGEQVNNLGRSVKEPFGNRERIGTLRTGINQTWQLQALNKTTVFIEGHVDYEFKNNMTDSFEDKTTVALKIGITWTPTPVHRIQLEWQEFRGFRNTRSRSGPVLVVLFDGL